MQNNTTTGNFSDDKFDFITQFIPKSFSLQVMVFDRL